MLTDSGQVPIERIRAGDLVWAADPDTDRTELKQVVQIFINETTELVHITVDDEVISCTPEHPFYCPTKGWTVACKLRAGDILVTVNGDYVVVERIQHELLESPIFVYNFEVEDFHTYYVSTISVLTHNMCSKNTPSKWDIRKYSKGQAKVNFQGNKLTAQFDGKYYWLDDLAGHGNSSFKVFRKDGKYLKWFRDADEFGNFITGKHKGNIGLKLLIG